MDVNLSCRAASLRGLRVGVDARAGSDRGTGVATYAAALAQTLARYGAVVECIGDGAHPAIGHAARMRRWVAAATPGIRRLAPSTAEGELRIERTDLFREAQVHFNLYGRVLTLSCPDPPEIMHWTYPMPLRLEGSRNIYTVHDAIPWDHPHLTGISRRRHQRLLDRISRTADAVITVSEHSRQALLRRMPHLAGPILNTFQALPEIGPAPDAPLPAGLSPGAYLLFCGSVEPRKNVARLIAAHRLSEVDLPLVIAGPDGWRADRELGGADPARVVRLPWVDRPLLVALIRQARALAFPSLAEGFGLPVLEAMALGVPVVTSDAGALAEIAGGAALTVDPYDVAAMARAIFTASTDEARRAALRREGLVRAQAFSSAAYAERLAEAYSSRS